MSARTPKAVKGAAVPAGYAGIHGGIVELLDAARQAAARSVNALMTASYWEIGRRIVEAEQQGKRRAGYGEQLIARLSADLTARFGRGFSPDNLENMRRFFAAYPRPVISEALSRKSGDGLPAEKSETVSRKLALGELAQVFASTLWRISSAISRSWNPAPAENCGPISGPIFPERRGWCARLRSPNPQPEPATKTRWSGSPRCPSTP